MNLGQAFELLNKEKELTHNKEEDYIFALSLDQKYKLTIFLLLFDQKTKVFGFNEVSGFLFDYFDADDITFSDNYETLLKVVPKEVQSLFYKKYKFSEYIFDAQPEYALCAVFPQLINFLPSDPTHPTTDQNKSKYMALVASLVSELNNNVADTKKPD